MTGRRNSQRIKVVDLELGELPEALEGLHGFGAVRAIFRVDGVPVGQADAPVRDGRCSTASLRRSLERRSGKTVERALARRSLCASLGLPAAVASVAGDEGDRPLISVIVCTHGRPEDLSRCLESIARLRFDRLEVVVVDNAPPDDRTESLLIRRFPRFRYVVEPEVGLDRARNRGILEARADIVAFTDDDTVVDPGWVDAIVSLFHGSPDVMAATGLVLPYELETDAQILFERCGGFVRGFERRWYCGKGSTDDPVRYHNPGQLGTGANMAFRKSLFDHIGSFDPALDVGTATGGGGDLDIFFRVLRAGYTLVYDPAAIVWHRHRTDVRVLARQMEGWGSGQAAFLARSWRNYPAERAGLLVQTGHYLTRWLLVRLLKSVLPGRRRTTRLVLHEALGALLGPWRYRRAHRENGNAVEGETPGACDDAHPLPVARGGARAVRVIDLDRPLEPLLDVENYAGVRAFFRRGGRMIGSVDLTTAGSSVSIARFLDAAAHVNAAGEAAPSEGELEANNEPLGSPPAISVVVCTRDRRIDLERCLAGLRSVAYPDFEVVVVDNASSDPKVAEVVARSGFRYVRESHVGLNFARNSGISAARYDTIAFIDDDATPDPGWLHALATELEDPRVGCVTGLVLPAELETKAQVLFEAYGGGMCKGFSRRRFERSAGTPTESIATQRIGVGTNMAFRRSALEAAGDFDPSLDVGTPACGAGDLDMFHRVLSVGLEIRYQPAALVWHRHRRTMPELERQLRDNGRSFGVYLLKLLRTGTAPRGVLLRYTLLEWLPWCFGRWVLGLFRLHPLPLTMLLAELFGALTAPFAYVASRFHVRRASPPSSVALTRRPVRAIERAVGTIRRRIA